MRQRLATTANCLLSVGVSLSILGLALNVVHGLRPSNSLDTSGRILLISGLAAFGISFLVRASVRPPSGERKRYVGVAILGIMCAVAIWVRDFLHFGPHGNWLWLIVLVLFGAVGVLLYWEDFRGSGSSTL